jgi:hypothetical protein
VNPILRVSLDDPDFMRIQSRLQCGSHDSDEFRLLVLARYFDDVIHKILEKTSLQEVEYNYRHNNPDLLEKKLKWIANVCRNAKKGEPIPHYWEKG